MSKKIRVVLIEDSLIALQILQRLLEDSQEVEVVGTAQDGAAGLELIGKVNPDVICTDLVMPRMDGLEFTKKVMELYPRPILVISNVVHPTDVDNIAKHTKVDMIWIAGRSPTLVSHSLRGVATNLKATTLTYLAISTI
jgi:chemotaxis response regulator CheB